MIRSIYLIVLIFFSFLANAGVDLSIIKAPQDMNNIYVKPLGSSEDASEFVIFVRNSVKAHYHPNHTELIYVLDGQGIFYLNDTKQIIKPGDFIRINKSEIHSVTVTSKQPLKVLSIQTPKFSPEDRVFVD